jgi:hypothetical protein
VEFFDTLTLNMNPRQSFQVPCIARVSSILRRAVYIRVSLLTAKHRKFTLTALSLVSAEYPHCAPPYPVIRIGGI